MRISNTNGILVIISEAPAFNSDICSWDTSNVRDMGRMFRNAKSFNHDLSSWTVAKVTNMNSMFFGAKSFGGDMSSWKLSSVTTAKSMFNGAASFNRNLCEWHDTFPYHRVADIFIGSGCTFQDDPLIDEHGPFCASSCKATQITTIAQNATTAPATIAPSSSSAVSFNVTTA